MNSPVVPDVSLPLMTDLAEFLLARIAEDEAAARAATKGEWTAVGTQFPDEESDAAEMIRGYVDVFPDGPGITGEEMAGPDAWHVARWDPARVLAECDAKRRIVEFWSQAFSKPTDFPGIQFDRVRSAAQWTLQVLALPYADHPGFREEWRP
jgi:hypothetical protein